MEAITIAEIQNAPAHRRNQVLVLMNAFGICGVDEEYASGEDRAISLLKLADFDLGSCTTYFWKDVLWMIVHGTFFRVVACLALHFGNRQTKI
jgi:hypothetical protein